MTSVILDFWKAHRSFWITPPSKQKEVDAYIGEKFWDYDSAGENLSGRIIYLDQFSRHFQRAGLCTEEEVQRRRQEAISIVQTHVDTLKGLDIAEILFVLMPFKHMGMYDFIFGTLHGTWLPAHGPLTDHSDLHRFYMDTYKKAYTQAKVAGNIIKTHPQNPHYMNEAICDYYPDRYGAADWSSLSGAAENPLLPLLRGKGPAVVSLSGGVDSMVMLALLKYGGTDVSAVHIIYGNRAESEDEYHFLAEFCAKLHVPFYVYRIEWLRRGAVDRPFYEAMTRDIRFAVYRTFGPTHILLGHIQDDVVENIWTNIAHCQHLGDLKKMKTVEVQEGVSIVRPFLTVEKAVIYKTSEALAIPYLKNTTPSWSNRGKFRDHFHGATVAQYGEAVDAKLIAFAEAVQKQNELLNALLYEPIYASFKDNKVNITQALKAGLDHSAWHQIFETLCHTKLGISKPSVKCVKDFCERLAGCWADHLHVEFGKHLKIKVSRMKDGHSILEFIKKSTLLLLNEHPPILGVVQKN
jgi:tRNA(Ile)-lysidine synthetase-like protein